MEILCQSILAFWFGSDAFNNSQKWFQKDPQYDNLIKKKFSEYMDHGFMGAFDRWTKDHEGLTALIILLDQFPRNAYRNQPQSFHFDKKALAVALTGIENKFYLRGYCPYGYFSLMPTMHSENIEIQNLGITCFEELYAQQSEPKAQQMIATALDYAKQHRDIIKRFNRFPHRNAILGRESTPEEVDFLQQKSSSF